MVSAALLGALVAPQLVRLVGPVALFVGLGVVVAALSAVRVARRAHPGGEPATRTRDESVV